MLFFMVWSDRGGHETYDQGLAALRGNPALCDEIDQLLAFTTNQIAHIPRPAQGLPLAMPLLTHARYRREEVLAAIGFANEQRKARGQAGGLTWAADDTIGAMFVNLHKGIGEFSPSTMYRDYAVSPAEFHWESPNATRVDSKVGQRLVRQRSNGVTMLLFVRERRTGDFGSEPFVFLGAVDYESHRGERPISITWSLRRPMPADVFSIGSVVAG